MIDKKFSEITSEKLKTLIEGTHKPYGSYCSYPFIVGEGQDTQIRWFYYSTSLKGNQWNIELIRVITLDKRGRCGIRLNPKLDEPVLLNKSPVEVNRDEFYKTFIEFYNAIEFDAATQLVHKQINPELQSLYQALKYKYLF